MSLMEENPTRRQIVELLKTRGPSTTDSLSKALKITPMGVRQHLLTLEHKGIVAYKVQKSGVGRPRFLYYLTEEAEELFPKRYSDFSLNLLRTIEKLEGRQKITRYLEEIKNCILKSFNDSVPEDVSVEERVKRFVGFLSSMDYIIEFEARNGGYIIKNFNCPFYRIVKDYPEVCSADYELYKEALPGVVKRQTCIQHGDDACIFSVQP